MSSRDPRFLKGVEHFNRREFYDAHEVWEDLWNDSQDEENRFVQGLIQFATSLHHFEARNLKGARILFDGGIELLQPFLERVYWGLPVGRLVEDMRHCLTEVLALDRSALPGRYHPDKNSFPVSIDEARIPKITLEQESDHG